MERDEIVWKNENRVSGALCFKDTRVPVNILTDHLRDGYTLDDFLEGFPSVSREQAQAFLELAYDDVKAATQPEKADARVA
ncbi:MAG: hypothetical protein BRD45_02880 [Bacteroidetes bacterium QS_8_64_10]|jgi:uncharacterized protein (DUF433 family)|nr:MAG: hypothetical protein BRD45_02880 [Bacteroidetes bacterium QS_8_64_10]